MAPKKSKKSKAELEEERIAREEEERKAKILEDKRAAEEAERQRLENLRIQAERKAFREAEIVRLVEEKVLLDEHISDRQDDRRREERNEVDNPLCLLLNILDADHNFIKIPIRTAK